MSGPGGTESHLYELSRRIGSAGLHAIVCNLAGDQSELHRVAGAGVETWPRDVPRLYTPGGRRQAQAIIAAAASRNIQAVQTFHFKSDWLGVWAARALHCPLISSRRDLGFAQTPMRRLAYRRINPFVDTFIAPSRAVRDAVAQREGVPAEKIEVIYNGLDLARFSQLPERADARRWLELPSTGPVIGMVGNLKAIKDHPTLLRAMAVVVAEQPDAHLVLIGEGPEEAALRALTTELGLDNYVTFTGQRQDIPRVLAALDVFVLSTHSEGMSNAIIEAMAAGLPVVASDVGGNAECVVDGQTGFIVPHADVNALAARLLDVLHDPRRAAAFGAAGRARAEELFDIEAMVRRTADLYRALSAAKGPAHVAR